MLNSQAISAVQQYLALFAASDGFEAAIRGVFGAGVDRSLLLGLRQQWLSGDFAVIPAVRVLGQGELGTANGAYAAALDQILISADFLERGDAAAVAGLLLEEIGHKLDRVLNGAVDTVGDEGAIFRLVVTGAEVAPEVLAGLRSVDDRGVIVLDGELVEIERQDFTGTAGNDTLVGTGGNDNFYPLSGADSIDGEAGFDVLSIDNSTDTAATTVTYTTTTNGNIAGGSNNGTTFKNIEQVNLNTGSGADNIDISATTQNNGVNFNYNTVRGGDGNDTIVGGTTGIGNYLFGDAGNDIITGGDNLNSFYQDSLYGGDGDDTLNGGAGNDRLYGEAGNDVLNGGDGNDTLSPGIGVDIVDGEAGFDVLSIDNSTDTAATTVTYTTTTNGNIAGGSNNGTTFKNIEQVNLNTGSGADNIDISATTQNNGVNYNYNTVRGGGGDDTIVGGATGIGNYIFGDAGNDLITGGDNLNSFYQDSLYGGDGDDTLNGGAGNDQLYGEAGNDVLNGGDGNDNLYSGIGVDVVDGEAGVDALNIDNSNNTAATTVNYTTTTNGKITGGSNDGTTFKNIEVVAINTGSGADNIDISATTQNNGVQYNYNTVHSGAGNDTIIGGATGIGNYLYGEGGNDIITGGDNINSYYQDYLFGGDGDDTLNGGAGDDRLYGEAGNDVLNGDSGNDYLEGGTGDNTLDGGDGKDYIRSTSAGDKIDGGNADDFLEISYFGQTNGVSISFIGNTATTSAGGTIQNIEQLSFSGGSGNDTVNAATANFTNNYYGSYSSELRGGAGDDQLNGGLNNDNLYGDDGSDSLNGGAGNDYLDGGAGNDTLIATDSTALNPGIGERDYLVGGTGSDRFILADNYNIYYDDRNITTADNNDYALITDFNPLEDQIQLQGAASRYILQVSGTNTNLFIDKPGTEPDELIGVFQNTTNLSLTSSAFVYVPPNAPPTAVTLSNITNNLLENTNTTNRLKVADISITDDAFGTNTLSLSGADASSFEIFNSGLYIKAGTNLDFETKPNYAVTVAVDDTSIGATPDATTTYNLTLTDVLEPINGTAGNDNLIGTSGNDTINGLAGNDYLNGSTGNDSVVGGDGNDIIDGSGDPTGLDTFVGGAGDDVYGVYNSATVIIEAANGGIDTVWTAVNYTLAKNVENLYLVGDLVGVGNNDNNVIIGYSAGNNTIYGLGGNDYIDAGVGNDYINGGLGNDSVVGGDGNDIIDGSGDTTGLDTFVGGAGDDVYGVYNSATIIVEEANGGIDTVWTAVNYTLASNVENLYLVGDLVGIGNNDNNTIVGYGLGNNTIYASGGNDYIDAGVGNDYINGGLGNDSVIGGEGNDIIDGSGDSTGLDTFAGGAGDDVYGVYNSATIIVEEANGGIDTVWTAVNYTLASNVENLYLVGDLNGTGNNGDNTIIGYGLGNNVINGLGGNDTLNGGEGNDTLNGGDGADFLSGGNGADTFVFQFGQSGVITTDRVTDFTIGTDKISLFSPAGLAAPAPVSFDRANNDATSTTLLALAQAVYADANGATTGNQRLATGGAALVVSTGAGIAGTYLVIDDGVAGFGSNDLVINITGYSGTLPSFGSNPVGTFF